MVFQIKKLKLFNKNDIWGTNKKVNFSPQSAAAMLVHGDEGLHISSQLMSREHPLDHQEDQPIFQ